MHYRRSRSIRFAIVASFLVQVSGCVQSSYRYGVSNVDLLPYLPQGPNVVTLGGEHPRLDVIERTVAYPRKWIRKWVPWLPKEELKSSEEKCASALESATEYLDDNNLSGVYIDVREYDPQEQWRRLRSNDRIAPIFKYTGGTLRHVRYCILPGRVFGFDSYNAYTNTLCIDSASEASAVFHAGYVKKLYAEKYPGIYMAANWLPIVPLWRDAVVSSDVLTYARSQQDWRLEKQLYPELYGRLAGDVVAQATSFVPAVAFYTRPVITQTGKVTGRLAGRAVAQRQEQTMKPQSDE
jgi:hypothetical protein